MHEEMKDRAQKEDRPGEDAQDVLLVFLPEKVARYRKKPDQWDQPFLHR